jgi:hypothetical protein
VSASIDASKGTREFPLPTEQLVVVNNYFWLHGRALFQKHPALNLRDGVRVVVDCEEDARLFNALDKKEGV